MYAYAPRRAHLLQHLSYAEYEGSTVHTQKCNVLVLVCACVFGGVGVGGGGVVYLENIFSALCAVRLRHSSEDVCCGLQGLNGTCLSSGLCARVRLNTCVRVV